MFYSRFVKLCNSIGKTPSAIANELGLAKSTVNRWKKGGMPSDPTLYKLADYFGVSVSFFADDEEVNAQPAPQTELSKYPKEVLDLVNDIYELDEPAFEMVKAFVRNHKKA